MTPFSGQHHLSQQEPVRTIIVPTSNGSRCQFPREKNEVRPGQLSLNVEAEMGPFKSKLVLAPVVAPPSTVTSIEAVTFSVSTLAFFPG